MCLSLFKVHLSKISTNLNIYLNNKNKIKLERNQDKISFLLNLNYSKI